jgi:hypothetical protein
MSSQLLRQDLIPIGTGYLILMAVLAAGLRLLRRGRGGQPDPPDAGREGSGGATSGGAGSGGATSGGAGPGGAISGGAGPGGAISGGAGPGGATSGGPEPGGAGSGGKAPSRVARRVRPGWPRFAVQVGGTALGGYLVLLAVDLGYYYGVARVAGQFLDSAVTGTALLLAVSLPLFAIRSWLAERRQDQGRR